VFPWPFIWGYARAAKDLGVMIRPFTEVVGFDTRGGRITGLRLQPTALSPLDATDEMRAVGDVVRITCDEVVLCAGAWSPQVAALVGLALPNKPHRHEICSTEPLKPWLGPLVADLSDGLYFSQSMRGEIVGGVAVEPVPEGINQQSSRRFLTTYARALVRAIPTMAGVRVLRQWAGCYDLTPDGSPIVGRVAEPSNLTLACGFMGHGFMMAPVMGRLLAEHVATGDTSPLFARWGLDRFARGELEHENMIIG
jgi:sarcosine oxidase subunit beta